MSCKVVCSIFVYCKERVNSFIIIFSFFASFVDFFFISVCLYLFTFIMSFRICLSIIPVSSVFPFDSSLRRQICHRKKIRIVLFPILVMKSSVHSYLSVSLCEYLCSFYHSSYAYVKKKETFPLLLSTYSILLPIYLSSCPYT